MGCVFWKEIGGIYKRLATRPWRLSVVSVGVFPSKRKTAHCPFLDRKPTCFCLWGNDVYHIHAKYTHTHMLLTCVYTYIHIYIYVCVFKSQPWPQHISVLAFSSWPSEVRTKLPSAIDYAKRLGCSAGHRAIAIDNGLSGTQNEKLNANKIGQKKMIIARYGYTLTSMVSKRTIYPVLMVVSSTKIIHF